MRQSLFNGRQAFMRLLGRRPRIQQALLDVSPVLPEGFGQVFRQRIENGAGRGWRSSGIRRGALQTPYPGATSAQSTLPRRNGDKHHRLIPVPGCRRAGGCLLEESPRPGQLSAACKAHEAVPGKQSAPPKHSRKNKKRGKREKFNGLSPQRHGFLGGRPQESHRQAGRSSLRWC